MTPLGPLWHVGIVVSDLDSATDELTEAYGVSWTSVQDQTVRVDVCGAEQTGRVRWVASAGEEPDLELVEAADGLWSVDPDGSNTLHHLAYWSEDLDADIARLTALDHTLEATGADGEGRLRFAYLQTPAGIRIELGARHTQAAWDEWVGGGGYGLEIA